MKRQVVGLKWARRLEGRPACIPQGRPRGAKALGIRYEKALGTVIGSRADRGVWFEFEDVHGRGYCQVDFLLDGAGVMPVVLECKHTWTEDGHVELEKLYLPVVSMALGRAVTGLVVTKILVPGCRGVVVCSALHEALRAVGGWNSRVVWHWIGIGATKGRAKVAGRSVVLPSARELGFA